MQFNKFDEIAILGKCFKYIDVSYIIHTTYQDKCTSVKSYINCTSDKEHIHLLVHTVYRMWVDSTISANKNSIHHEG